MIRAAVFDIGDVVCAFRPDRRLRALARVTGLDPERVDHAIWVSGLDRRAEAGELSPGDTERLILDALEHRVDAEGLRAAWSTAFVPDLAMCEMVARLDTPVFAFTNNGPMFTACLGHELAAVEQLFQRVICSWQIRARKPDPEAFVRLGAELQLQPQELVFVDDRPGNTGSARSVGLSAITFTSAEQLERELLRAGAGRA